MFEYWKNQHTARGFTPGGIFVKDNLVYIPIPKNSSSYVGQLLLKNNWNISNFLTTDLTNKQIIILLRDPVDRWISGMAQYLCSSLLGRHCRTSDDIIKNWNSIVQDLVFDRIIFDDHTEKQVYFIQSVPKENCVFFDSAKQPDQAIKQYLATQDVDLNINIDCDRNKTQGNSYKEILVSFLRHQLAQNPSLTNKLMNTYREDYILWNEII
jgi:hypothetical protein